MLIRSALTLGLACLVASIGVSAAAHSPYFSEPLDCSGAAGTELRFLFGDGIILPDPMAIAVLDLDGHILAFQDVGRGSFPVPRGECAIADPFNGVVLHYSPGEYEQAGARLIGDGYDIRDNRWAFEPGVGHEGFGFRTTPLSEIPLVTRLSAEFRYGWPQALAIALFIFCGILILWALIGAAHGLKLHWRVLVIASGGIVLFPTAFIGLLVIAFTQPSGLMLSSSIGLALIGFLLVRKALRARQTPV